jgi:hypothetical protein
MKKGEEGQEVYIFSISLQSDSQGWKFIAFMTKEISTLLIV